MQFQVDSGDAWHPVDVETHELVIAGMTGRDLEAVQAHSAEPARRPSGIGPGADRSSGHLDWSTLP